MNNFFATALIMLLSLLSGCVQPPLMVGKAGPAVSPEQVVVYFPDRPRCNFETLAHIQINGGYLSLESMFRKMRMQAAAIGADGLYVLHTQRMEIREYLGNAKAIRCLPAGNGVT